jgi:hypothetical protein
VKDKRVIAFDAVDDDIFTHGETAQTGVKIVTGGVHPLDLPESHGMMRHSCRYPLKRRSMSVLNALASVAVKDLTSAVKWYERLLGRPASRPMPEVAEWSFERGGGLQVYQLSERAGSGSFTLAVSSMEEQITHLENLNIDTRERASSDKVKTVMIADPDGNHIAFAEALDPSLAQ